MVRFCLAIMSCVSLWACDAPTSSTAQHADVDGGPDGGDDGSINSCDDGVAACNGDPRCESCLIEGECASGPSPVWLVAEARCVCTDDDPTNCKYRFCCVVGDVWDPQRCTCVPATNDDDHDGDSGDHDGDCP